MEVVAVADLVDVGQRQLCKAKGADVDDVVLALEHAVNFQPLSTICVGLLLVVLLAPRLAADSSAGSHEFGLSQAVREALDANLDLAAQRRALAADREAVAMTSPMICDSHLR